MRYMLDTDICIYAINERPPGVLQALRDHQSEGLGVSAITAAELHFGVARSASARNAQALRRFLAVLEVAPFNALAGEVSGRVRAWLAEQGTPIGPYDSLIAAHAQSLDVTLVTNNTREFKRVPGLKLANWAE
ncbi:MAG: type II toxin-antitoxin system VapC family toxin [Rubrivivax sp.]